MHFLKLTSPFYNNSNTYIILYTIIFINSFAYNLITNISSNFYFYKKSIKLYV